MQVCIASFEYVMRTKKRTCGGAATGIDHENAASAKVLGKIGLKETGDRRAYAANCLGFRVTRGEWLKSRSR